MTYGEQPSLAELDEVLSRAVERQIGEQRALRQALEELRDAVRELADREQVIEAPEVEIDFEGIDERVRRAVEGGVARLEGELRDIRGALDPQFELTQSASQLVRSLRDDMRGIGDSLGEASADIEGIAQALVELNAGLRGWADDVDSSVASLRDAVEGVREISQTKAVAEAAEREKAKAREKEKEAPPALPAAPLEAMEQQLKESAELSLYISDQIEELDGVLKKLGELPERLEGVMAQAIRRTLAAGAKLEQDAASIFDALVESLENSVARLTETLEAFDATDVRKLALGQVEVTSRLDTLNETLLARIHEVEDVQRASFEELADAIRRSSEGRSPASPPSPSDDDGPAGPKPKPPAARKRGRRGASPEPADAGTDGDPDGD